MSRPSDSDAPELLLEWREPISTRRFLFAGLGSVAVHAAIAGGLLLLPDLPRVKDAPVVAADVRKSVKLIAPRFFEPTQKAPNQGKIKRELDVRSAAPAAREQAPARFQPPPSVSSPDAGPAPLVSAEPPKIEIAAAAPPVGGIPPQAPPQEKPKLAFENVGSGSASRPGPAKGVSTLPQPKTSIQEVVRGASQPGGGGGVTVGDALEEPPSIAGMNSATPGPLGSQLQLLSDPNGVDFKPYLLRVLAAVRSNWMSVIPESARMGRRGQVLIQFIIDRKGEVPKLVIATPSGTEALDRAAVAGISASYPFPPLPPGYKGDQIRLQLAFSYNMRAR